MQSCDYGVKSTKQRDLWISGPLCWVNERYPCIENSLSSYLNGRVRWIYNRRVVRIHHCRYPSFYIWLDPLSIHLWGRNVNHCNLKSTNMFPSSLCLEKNRHCPESYVVSTAYKNVLNLDSMLRILMMKPGIHDSCMLCEDSWPLPCHT